MYTYVCIFYIYTWHIFIIVYICHMYTNTKMICADIDSFYRTSVLCTVHIVNRSICGGALNTEGTWKDALAT